jgi:hypothetical protein
MKNFLILVVMVIIHRSLADVSGDGVIMPTKCEGKFRDIATLMLAIHCMIDISHYFHLFSFCFVHSSIMRFFIFFDVTEQLYG